MSFFLYLIQKSIFIFIFCKCVECVQEISREVIIKKIIILLKVYGNLLDFISVIHIKHNIRRRINRSNRIHVQYSFKNLKK